MSCPNVAAPPRVFVVVPGDYDYSAANKWGEVIFLFTQKRDFSPYNMKRTIELTKAVLAEHEVRADDYLILTGHSHMTALVTSWMLKHYGRYQILVFGSRDQDYVVQEIKERDL